jgi:hypothetical protein
VCFHGDAIYPIAQKKFAYTCALCSREFARFEARHGTEAHYGTTAPRRRIAPRHCKQFGYRDLEARHGTTEARHGTVTQHGTTEARHGLVFARYEARHDTEAHCTTARTTEAHINSKPVLLG